MSSLAFQEFANALRNRFISFGASPLFRVAVSGDELWAAYLAAFPEGTNPIYRVRTEHDGSYDRSFVRKLGNVVQMTPDGLKTIWGDHYLTKALDAAQEALAKLDGARDPSQFDEICTVIEEARCLDALRNLVAALRAQEPVAWGMPLSNGDIIDCISSQEHAKYEGGYTVALYLAPPAQPQENNDD